MFMSTDPLGEALPARHTPEADKAPPLSARERRRMSKRPQHPQVVDLERDGHVDCELHRINWGNAVTATLHVLWLSGARLPAGPSADRTTTPPSQVTDRKRSPAARGGVQTEQDI